MVGKRKIREEQLLILQLLRKVHRNSEFQTKGMEISMFLPQPLGFLPYLLLTDGLNFLISMFFHHTRSLGTFA
jgi:hypothetical protein